MPKPTLLATFLCDCIELTHGNNYRKYVKESEGNKVTIYFKKRMEVLTIQAKNLKS